MHSSWTSLSIRVLLLTDNDLIVAFVKAENSIFDDKIKS